MSKPVVVRLPDGREVGLESETAAKEHYPEGIVTGYQDGQPIVVIQPDANGEVNLAKLKRDELETYAAAHGVVNAADLATKDDIIAAIDAATAPAEAS